MTVPPLQLNTQAARARALRLYALDAFGSTPMPPSLPCARRVHGARRGVPRVLSFSALQPRAGRPGKQMLTDMQRNPAERPSYLPHEVLRAAIELDEERSDAKGDAPTMLYVTCERTVALLAGNLALTGCRAANVRREGARCYVLTLQHDDNDSKRRKAAAPARRRLLRLLNAVEAIAPEMLRGRKHMRGVAATLLRTCALSAFAAHVPECEWEQPPETWTPHRSHRCVLDAALPGAPGAHALSYAALCSRCAHYSPTSLALAFQCLPLCTAPLRRGTRSTQPLMRAAMTCGVDLLLSSLQRRAVAASGAHRTPRWHSQYNRWPDASMIRMCRDALRMQFPSLCISREAAHAFTEPCRKLAGRLVCIPRMPQSRSYDTPFGALRVAQLRALGMQDDVAELVATYMLPLSPCADAGGEQLLLDAVRFLVKHRHIGHVWPAVVLGDYIEVRRNAELFLPEELRWLRNNALLGDTAFLLDCTLRAAALRGQPQGDCFSFSGRTLQSFARHAAEHRRNALVAAASSLERRGAFFDSSDFANFWRMPLRWDDGCDQAYALQRSVNDGNDEERWSSSVVLLPRSGGVTLNGEWRMRRLTNWAAIRKEAAEQENCLYEVARKHVSQSSRASYWSLRFMPDADSLAQLSRDERLRQSAEHLQLTVHVEGDVICQVKATGNKEPSFQARNELDRWSCRALRRVSAPAE